MEALSPALRRRLVGTAIVLFWLVMTGLLVERELRRRAVPPSGTPALTVASERWFAIELGGKPAGRVHVVEGPEEFRGRPGDVLRIEGELEARVAEAPMRLRIGATLRRSLAEPRGELDARVDADGHSLRLHGRIANGELVGTLFSGGQAVPVRVPVEEVDLLAGPGSFLALPEGTLKPGEERTVRALDPLTLAPAALRLRCLREERLEIGGQSQSARVLAVDSSGVTLTAWVAENGEVLRAETPFGLTLRRIGRDEAFAAHERLGASSLGELATVVPTGARPRRDARRMVVRVGGLDPGTTLPEDDVQRFVAPATYEVIRPAEPSAHAPSMIDVASLRADLAADALVQADQPAIRNTASAIVGRKADPWRRALALERWVNANLAKRNVWSLPSALDVLSSREGDCNEHTVLFTALARAAGIPTRMVVGVVWSDELGGFGYHAWPEVFVGRWVPMDPTLGQPVADATHLALLVGGVERWPQVLAFLGRLRLDVVEVE